MSEADRKISRSFSAVRCDILGVAIDAVTLVEAERIVAGFIAAGRPHFVATANAEMVMAAGQDAELARILAGADLVVPDGPAWFGRLAGLGMPCRSGWRVSIWRRRCWPGPPSRAGGVFFRRRARYCRPGGGSRGCTWPGLTVAGVRHGYFDVAESDGIVAAISAAKPHILLAALGVPKQGNGWRRTWRDWRSGIDGGRRHVRRYGRRGQPGAAVDAAGRVGMVVPAGPRTPPIQEDAGFAALRPAGDGGQKTLDKHLASIL
jgi:hypothetical protein